MYQKDWELCLCTSNFMWTQMADILGNSTIFQRNWKIVSNQFWIVRLNDWAWNTVKTYLYIRDTYDIGNELENVTKKKNVRAYCYGSHWDYGFVEVIVLTSWSIEKREKERKKRKTEYSKQKKIYTTQILHCSCASLNQKGIGLANLPDECSPLGFPIFFSALILNCFLLVRLFFRSYFFFFIWVDCA